MDNNQPDNQENKPKDQANSVADFGTGETEAPSDGTSSTSPSSVP